MDDTERATLLFTQELLVTLIKRMAAAGILSEHGADALASEVAASATTRSPNYAQQFASHAAALRQGIREECADSRGGQKR